MGCPVKSSTQDNEAVSEELPQESDGVTSCMWGCTILQKTGHAELVWSDILGSVIVELLEHGPVALTFDHHRPAVVILKPLKP